MQFLSIQHVVIDDYEEKGSGFRLTLYLLDNDNRR